MCCTTEADSGAVGHLPLFGSAGEAGVYEGLRDMTEHNRAQEMLLQSEERLRLFVENVTDYALLQELI